MTYKALKQHGRAIIETAKDHMVAALSAAPSRGWTAVEWGYAAGLLVDGASFSAVLVHHVGPVLVAEGRVSLVEGDDGMARYAWVQPPPRAEDLDAMGDSISALSAATQAPRVWSTANESRTGPSLPRAEEEDGSATVAVANPDSPPPSRS